jgi:hypothetical protein
MTAHCFLGWPVVEKIAVGISGFQPFLYDDFYDYHDYYSDDFILIYRLKQ